ncbi:hypothetical protein GCM10009676_09530 [Prauserella halophila]|uniref:Carrier domain-containing protein n=1 Tax=Prauserella halophila TaxID=185641 RepID=A0ABP4GLK7_9PSEU
MQEGLLFHSLYDSTGDDDAERSDVYTVQFSLGLTGDLDTDLLARSIAALLERHANLRAAFRQTKSGTTVQVIATSVPTPLRVHDASTESAPETEADAIADDDRARPFDLKRPPLLRFSVVHLGERRHRLVVTNHHVVLDGWSMPVLVQELFALYAAGADAGTLPRVTPYRDYIGWLAEQDHDAGREAWRRVLDGVAEPTLVSPADPARAPVRPATTSTTCPAELAERLAESARRHHVTVPTLVQAAWGMTVGRHTGRDDVVFGSTVSGRPPDLPGVETMVGLFINTIPVRMRLDPAATIHDVLTELSRTQGEVIDHQHTRLSDIAAVAGAGELFDTLVVFENYPLDPDALELPGADLAVTDIEARDNTHYPLTLVALPGDELTLRLDYRTDLFDDRSARRLLDRMTAALHAIADRPDERLSTLDLLTEDERTAVLTTWNDTRADLAPVTLPAMFERAAAATPSASCLVHGADVLSYDEVNARANRLARALCERGVGPEKAVALVLPRSPELVIAALAVTKAGGAYLPIDPDYPDERISFTLADADPVLVIAAPGAVPGDVETAMLVIDGPGDLPTDGGSGNLTDTDRTSPLLHDHPAYLIYTSGSTGTPKGVVVTHRGIASFAESERERFAGSPDARVLQYSSPSFDAFVLELCLAFRSGATLVVPDNLPLAGEILIDTLVGQRVTHALIPPVALASLPSTTVDDLTSLIVGGDATTADLVARWAPGRCMVNAYGPTESTVVATTSAPLAPDEGTPPIGTPLWNTRVYVLDDALRPVAPDSPGELYLAGESLARGYHGRAALTAERFVADPFGDPGDRMYRTGDLVSWRESGELDFHGRSDDQVKIRGFRIELGEIESVLLSCARVDQVAVVAREDRPGVKQLVAYVVGTAEHAELRTHVAASLPDHMCPAAYVTLDGLPMTANGSKLDRKALPAPQLTSAAPGRAPATEAERAMVELFGEVLGVPEIGADDSFFDLGGDSIISIQLVSRARRAGFAFTPKDVFTLRTPATLAGKTAPDAAGTEPDDPDAGVGAVPLTPIMHWLREQGGPISAFHQSMLVRVPAGLNDEGVSAVLAALADRHDALRLKLTGTGPVWALEARERGNRTVPVSTVDIRGMSSDEIRAAVAVESDAIGTRLDPEAGIMAAAVRFDAGDEPGRLLLAVHHLAVDGVSWRILLPDLAAAWRAVAAGATPDLPPIGTPLRHWAQRLGALAHEPARLHELEVWSHVLRPAEPITPRPLDPAHDTVSTVRTVGGELPPGITGALLTRVPAAFHADVNDVLLTALAVAVARWRSAKGHTDRTTLLHLESHGRHGVGPDDASDLSRTVGWLTSMYPVRLDLDGVVGADSDDRSDMADAVSGGRHAGAALKAVKEQLRALPDHGIGFGLLRYLNPQTGPALASLATPQIGFNYLGRFADASENADFAPAAEAATLGGGTAGDTPVPHALEITALTRDGHDGPTLRADWSWPGEMFDHADVAELSREWFDTLRGLVAHTADPGAGGHTPSDFELVDLTQSEVDELMPALPAGSDLQPLSSLQEGLLFHAGFDAAAPDIYTVQLAIELSGAVDSGALRGAAESLLHRQAGLRTGFRVDGLSHPVAFVPPEVPLPWRDVDLSAHADPLTALADVRAEEKRRFDLSQPPLLRFALVRLAADRYTLVLTNHHILLDGWSMPLLAAELFTAYAGAPLPPVSPYRDYLAWCASQDRAAAERTWLDVLDGVTEPTLLAGGDPPADPATSGRHTVRIPESLTQALTSTARDSAVTVNTVLQAAWGLVLAGVTGRSDVLFGATTSGRPPELPGVESMIGLFINTLPVRVRLDPHETVAGLLDRLQRQRLDVTDHSYVGLTDIQRLLGTGELFDTLMVFENYPLDPDRMVAPGSGVSISNAEVDDATHYPLTLVALPGDELHLTMTYRDDVFDPSDVERLADRLVTLLTRITDDPALPVGRMETLLADERELLLSQWNGTAVEVPATKGSVQDRFAHQAAATPNTVAVSASGTEVTYAELDRRANQRAHQLLRLGVRPEDKVAILQQRSVELVVSTLAVLKAGGSYVPLDGRSPDGRLERVLAQTAAPVLLTDGSAVDRELEHHATVIDVDTDGAVAEEPVTAPDVACHPSSLAYVMYTSGSTGVPKGVAVTHHDVLSLAFDRAWDGANQERVLLHSPHAFDASTYELWVPLLTGRRLVVAPAGELDMAELADVITGTGITGLWLTAGLFRLLAEEHPDCFAGVREVWSGGDVVPPALVRKVLEVNPELVVGDGYGPTEVTTFATYHLMSAGTEIGSTVPIGRPLDNMRTYVLDDRLRLVPPGSAGELYIAGAGVARGYLDRPELTAERFVGDPYGPPGARMYRTGDLVRWIRPADGEAPAVLEFVGRADEQVKIRGFRIEIGEIEAVISAQPDVAQVAVIIREDRPGDKRIVAYLVGDPDIDAVRDRCTTALPEYMVPSAFVALDTLPLTTNGKLDRRALPEPDLTAAATFREPRTPREEILCGLFAEVLGVAEVGIDDGFFALGGHSLLATRLVSKIRSSFGVELPIRALFEAPTVATLAGRFDSAQSARTALVRYDRPEVVPASYGQRRLWFLNKFEGDASPYKIPIGLRLRGDLDRGALRAALQDVLERHEVLRTVYPEVDGEPVQRVLDADPATPTIRHVPITEDDLRDAVHRDVAAGFDLAVDPPVRATVFQTGEADFFLLLVLHHIAADGWSMAPMGRDLGRAYAARVSGESPEWTELPVQYADYSLWQHDVMGTEDDPESGIARQVEFWRDTLADLPEELDLPTDRPRPTDPTYAGGTVMFELDAQLHAGLTALAREHGTSLFMVFQSALATLLTRVGAGTDIPIGSPIAGRTDDALDDLVGFFINTLVLRTDTAGDPTFAELLGRVRDTLLAAYAHQDLPFERLVEILKPARVTGRNPLFQVLLVLQNNASTTLELPGVDVEVEPADVHAAQFDLSVDLTERHVDSTEAGIGGRLDYSAELFDDDTARGLLDRFTRLLQAIVADPNQHIATMPILSDDEERRLLAEFNATDAPVDREGVVEKVRRHAEVRPDATALADEHGTVSYAALDRRAGALSRLLTRSGSEPGAIAAVLADRSTLVPTAVLGILGAGAAYTPLDPRAPRARQVALLRDSGARWLLVEPSRTAEAAELATAAGTGVTVVTLSDETLSDEALSDEALSDEALSDEALSDEALSDEALSDEALDADTGPSHPPRSEPEDLAYVIFTSGSTGRPKGAMVHHGGMVNHLLAKVEDLELTESDSLVQNAPLSFDISVWQMLAAFVVGGTTRIVNDDTALDPAALFDLTASERITMLEVVPSLLRTALDSWDNGSAVQDLTALRWLMVTGEALPESVCRRWFDRFPDIPLVNAYGPTECSDDVTHAVITERTDLSGRIPIGRAVRNTQLYVLDEQLEPLPIGVVGELCVGGAGVGHGYLADPAKTARAFVPDPFSGVEGARLYRTGDRVRYRPDGQLEFLGRIDHQVKIRGQRIELGEVEAAIRELESVSDALVVVHPDPSGQQRLVGYVVGDADPTVARERLSAALPDAMIPAVLIGLDTFPLTRNGKIDRKALPAPEFGFDGEGREPSTPTESILASIFTEVLGVYGVGATDDFFDLGGHSLLATRLVNRIRSVFGVELPVRTVFDSPTIQALGGRLDAEGAGDAQRPPLRPMPRGEHVPLSYAQRRMWFLNRLEGSGGTYNVPVVLRLSGELGEPALRSAVTDVVTRHEVLRTVFTEIDGEPYQKIIPADVAVPEFRTVTADPEQLDEEIRNATRTGFDLTHELPVRVTLLSLSPREHVLVVVMHHIASDGGSAKPLATDLARAYTARRDGQPPQWSDLPVQYADYALWQRQVLGSDVDEAGGRSPIARQLTYWTDALAGIPEGIELPTDRPRPASSDFAGDTVPMQLDADLHARLEALAAEHSVSLAMVVQAGVAALLCRLGAGTDVPIGSPVAGRTDEALDDLIGFFVNTLVLRTDTSGDPSFTDLLARVRETDLEAFANQDVPFERLVEELNPPRSLSRHPLFQVILSFANHEAVGLDLPGLRVQPVPVTTGGAKVDLSFKLGEQRGADATPQGITGLIEFRTDLFDAESVAGIATRLERLLRAAASEPAAPVGDIDLTDPAERTRLLTEWNDTATDVPDVTAPELFTRQARRTPDAIAVTDGHTELTYSELDRRAVRVAAALQARGAGPEHFVAVSLPRSPGLLVALLGVLRSGAAYVPVDPGYPPERIEFMLADTGPALLITDDAVARDLPATAVERITVPELEETGGDPASEDTVLTETVRPCNPAYVIYTSGSTGRPKGVVIEHRALVDYLTFAGDDYAGVRGQTLLHSPISFDLTVTAMFVPLTVGGTVRVASFDEADPDTVEQLRRSPANFVKATPSHLPLLESLPPEYSPDTELLLGGELLLGELVDRWRTEHPGVTVLNMYGPTETTVNCTEFRIEPGDPIPHGPLPIGTPLDNTRLYVLDERLRLVPAGSPGELYVAGDGLARGYLNRPESTSAKFVADPFGEPGERMYRTGDVVRWNGDGTLSFLRRVDDQVKLRGFRIELGEVEAVLDGHPAVDRAAVVVREDQPGDQRLVGYVTAAADGRADPAELRSHAADTLPEYMVPNAVVVLDRLPLTPNGKLDRGKLPAPTVSTGGRGPRGQREQLLCELFAESLGLDRVGIDDGFFDLGGHSLLATKLITRVRATLGVDIAIRTLFEAPTVAQLVPRLDDPDTAEAGAFDVVLPLRSGGDENPLFCIHPASGFSWSYAGLIRHIDPAVPLYGLQSAGLAADEPLPPTVPDMAARYVDEIRRVRPEGPYRILGWSFGGIVAHEMAYQLERAGERVELLAMLDSFPKSDAERADTTDIDERELYEALLDLAGYDPSIVGEGVLDRARITEMLREQGGILGEITERELGALYHVYGNNTALAREFVPSTISSDVVLFVATDDETEPDMQHRWTGHITGTVTRIDVPSRHNDMTRPAQLALIGSELATRLRNDNERNPR